MTTALILVASILFVFALVVGLASGSSRRGLKGLVAGQLAPLNGARHAVVSEGPDANIAPLPPATRKAVRSAMTAINAAPLGAKPGYLAFVARSPKLGGWDHVEFRFTPDATHVRSATKRDYADFGANRERVEALRLALGETAAAGDPDVHKLRRAA